MEKKTMDIPEVLYSFNTGTPFTNCIECEVDFSNGEIDYFVEKVFRNYLGHKAQDVIIDYAICMNCAHQHYQKISKESMLKIQQYLGPAMLENMQSTFSLEEELYQQCVVHGTPISESEEYQIFGHCKGDQLLFDTPPYAIGWKAIDEMSSKISKSTKDEMDDFFNKHFTPDPNLFSSSTRPKLVLI
ncbi:MAG: hypothetical protein ACI83B_003233 [Sediminicola sp.]|jgi:hypothetical protein